MSEAQMPGRSLMSLVDLGSTTEELTRAWSESGEARKRDFLDDLLTETLLTEVFAEQAVQRRRARVRWAAGLAAAGILVIAGIAGWMTWGKQRYPRPELSGHYLVCEGKALIAPGDIQRGNRVLAEEGGATFKLNGICELTLDAGTDISWQGSPNHEVIGLDLGKMRSVVEPAKGTFTVETPRGSLKVVGTDFVTEVRYETLGKEGGEMKMSRLAIVSVMVAAGVVSYAFGSDTGVLNAGMEKTFLAEGDRPAEPPAAEKKPERQEGEISGMVKADESLKEGVVRLALTITTEYGAELTFLVGPANTQAYATVGSLKAGEKVRLGWVSEGGDKKWIRTIRRLEGGEGERREGERKEGERRYPEGTR